MIVSDEGTGSPGVKMLEYWSESYEFKSQAAIAGLLSKALIPKTHIGLVDNELMPNTINVKELWCRAQNEWKAGARLTVKSELLQCFLFHSESE